MARELTQRQLRNESGEVMRSLDQGEQFVVTRSGVPVGRLLPIERARFVVAAAAVGAFTAAAPVEGRRLREDLDRIADPDPGPRV